MIAGTSDKPPQNFEDLFHAEQQALEQSTIIPILHVPISYAMSGRLRAVSIERDGKLHLEDAWITKP